MVPPTFTFSGVFFHAGLVGPFAGLQGTFDIDLRAFTQVLAGHFGQFAEQHHAVPLGLLFGFAGLLVTPAFGGGQSDVGNGTAVRHVADFRILTQIAD